MAAFNNQHKNPILSYLWSILVYDNTVSLLWWVELIYIHNGLRDVYCHACVAI